MVALGVTVRVTVTVIVVVPRRKVVGRSHDRNSDHAGGDSDRSDSKTNHGIRQSEKTNVKDIA